MSKSETHEEEEEPQPLNMGRPLFSLQVDDVLIQELFKNFAAQIKSQQEEISFLKSELNNRPKMEDFVNLSEAVISLQKQANDSSQELRTTVHDFHSSIEQRSQTFNQILQTKVNDMLFSVNAAIRGELEALEKTPVNTKQAIDDVHNIKLKVSKMEQKLDDLKETVIQMAAAYDGNMRFDSLNRKTVPSCVGNAAARDRTKIEENTAQIAEIGKKVDDFIETFNRILTYQDSQFPQFNNKNNYNRKDTPSYPPLPNVTSFNDFSSYVCDVVPILQNVSRELYSYISQVEAKVNITLEKKTFESFQNEIRKTLSFIIEETDDYRAKKNNLVMKEDFQNLSDHLFDVVNGASNSSLTNTRCVACGKIVQNTSPTSRTAVAPVSIYQTAQYAKSIPPHPQKVTIQRASSAKQENRNHYGSDGIESMRIEPVESRKLHSSAKSSVSRSFTPK